MPIEIDVHCLPNCSRHYGWYLNQTQNCSVCPSCRSVVNRDWAPGHDPIGKVCFWGKDWKWLTSSSRPKRRCGLLSRPLPSETLSQRISGEGFVPQGVRGEDFSLGLYKDIVELYHRKAGGMSLSKDELKYYYTEAVKDLRRTNTTDLRLGSFVSGDSKLTIEWRFLSPHSSESVLFFSCYSNTDFGREQGEYLSSRFELAVNQLLQERGLAVPIHK